MAVIGVEFYLDHFALCIENSFSKKLCTGKIVE